ncbi:UNVERIFIED_CONTAM: HNH/ENDO VII superfamily nuclease [Acetivibrio alkalicellulosi]
MSNSKAFAESKDDIMSQSIDVKINTIKSIEKMTVAGDISKEEGRYIIESTIAAKSIKKSKEAINYKYIPKSDGSWLGEEGNSKWIPNKDKIPGKMNPDEKTWEQILNTYEIDGIEYSEGEPNFIVISRGTVDIEGFSEDRDKNFTKADEAEARKRGCSSEEVFDWRKENRYTWHERKNCKTMDKVPSEVHNNMSHSGGISQKKKEISLEEWL